MAISNIKKTKHKPEELGAGTFHKYKVKIKAKRIT